MTKNRKLREEGIQLVKESERKARELKALEICTREKAWVAATQKDSLESRANLLVEAKTSAGNSSAVNLVGEVVDRILDLVDWTATTRHIGLFHEVVPPHNPPEDETDEAKAAREEAAAAAAAFKEANPFSMDMLPEALWLDAKEAFLSNFPMPEATMKPYETNVYDDLPYSECSRPLCVDLNWLLSEQFQAHSQMAPVGTLEREIADLAEAMKVEMDAKAAKAQKGDESAPSEGEAAVEETSVGEKSSVPLKTCFAVDAEVPAERVLAEHLSTVDADSFISKVGNVELEGYGEAAEAGLPAENSPQDEGSEGLNAAMQVSPDWLYTTAPKHMVGEVLIATSCAANPVPDDPEKPVDIPPLPLRAAVCSVSDVSRKDVSAALKEKIPDLAIINSETLVHRAVQLAKDTLFEEAQSEASEIESRSSEQKLAIKVLDVLQGGEVLTDELYTALVANAITSSLPPVPAPLTLKEQKEKAEADALKTEKVLAEEAASAAAAEAEVARKHPGFLLEDYPCTKKQSILLFQALSGIAYDQDKPKPGDRASAFARARPETYDRCQFDPSKCGLNKVFCVDHSDIGSLTHERVHSRTDLNTGEVVQLGSENASIETLQELYTPLRPVQTTSVEHAQTAAEKGALTAFLQDMQLLNTYSIGKWDGDFGDRASAVKAILEDVSSMTGLFVLGKKETTELTGVRIEGDDRDAELNEGESVDAPKVREGEEVNAATDTAAAGVTDDENPTTEVKKVTPAACQLAQPVAQYLMGMWGEVEKQSTNSIRSYFASMRDVRYQMSQRRRMTHDVLQRFLVKRDGRQQMFEEFRDMMNMLEDNMRFDNFIVGELYLRALELGRAIWTLSDEKRDEAVSVLEKVSKDGMTQVHTHRCQVEGAVLIQAELKRFLVSMHILFDYTKGTSNMDRSALMRNSLEECLAVVTPKRGEIHEAAGGKDKGKDKGGKKGEAAAAVAWRNVVPPVVLPVEMMQVIPSPPADEPPADPKAKGKPAKGKVGGDEAPANPLDTMCASALSVLGEWSKDTFTVQRAVYGTQESLCAAIEAAVWHEAERCKYSITTIKAAVEKQVSWIASTEKDAIAVVKKMIHDRHTLEYQVTHRLVHMIGDVISQASKIQNIWEIDGDAITVFQDQLCEPLDPLPPLPEVTQFHDGKLNDEQLMGFAKWIDSVKTGSVVLEEDIRDMLARALSSSGSISNAHHNTTLMYVTTRNQTHPDTHLAVTLVSCKDLHNADASGASDPYCILRIQEKVHVSHKVENNLNPEYNEDFLAPWTGTSGIKLLVYDHDVHSAHDLIGSADIAINEYIPQLEAGEVVTIEDAALTYQGAQKGFITVKLSMPPPMNSAQAESDIASLSLPPLWRKPENFTALMDALIPEAQVCATGERVGYVDSTELLNALRDFSCIAETRATTSLPAEEDGAGKVDAPAPLSGGDAAVGGGAGSGTSRSGYAVKL